MNGANFKRTAVSAALGAGVFGMAAPGAALAAPVGNMATSGDNRWALTIGAEHSRRDMRQRGETSLGRYEFFSENQISEYFEESFSGLDAREDQTDLFAQIHFSVTPRIELYGRAGASRTRLSNFSDFFMHATFGEEFEGVQIEDRVSFSESGDMLNSGRSNTGWLVALGAKFNLHEWQDHNTALNLDVMHQWRNSGASWDLLPPGNGERLKIDGYSSEEWHAALILERTTGSFRPYGGLKYSRIKSDYDTVRASSDPMIDGQTSTLQMRNRRELGFLGGMEFLMNSNMSLVGEVRAGDETALNVGLRYKFQ